MDGKKYLVVGSGISGVAAAKLLESEGKEVILYDSNEKLAPEELKERLGKDSSAVCITGVLTDNPDMDEVVLSPGVPTDLPWICDLREKGVPILGEIELAYRQEQGQVIAITGTNGKTTTTTLVGEIMKAHLGEDQVFVVGNIGNPYTQIASATRKDTVTVAEISSFQLETIHTFRPKVSAILNITPDHMNRHHTMETYVKVKESIAANQTKLDICVLNYQDPYTRDVGERCPARVVWFSTKDRLKDGYFLEGDWICASEDGKVTRILNICEDMNLVGICNAENVMAAIGITRGMDVPMETILKVIKGFKAVEHRIEYVAAKGGVDYYNDSKATNPDAAIQGIRAMRKPTILIGGGFDKESTYDEWIESFDGKVKHLVLIGQTREKIAACAAGHGLKNITLADSFEECLKICTNLAGDGDAVLLSPACASWDMFPNYEVRGKIFKEYVQNLPDE